MAIDVYGWKKPTVSLELVEGGSLLADTTYYVTGLLKWDTYVYQCSSSPLADVVSITTTSTSKSINILQRTYRTIDGFEVSGSITTISSSLHCLTTNDIIKIQSGSYSGSWAITKLDADHYSITSSYIDNIAVESYTDAIYYNKPTLHTSGYPQAMGMDYYVYTSDPRATGVWTGGSRWTDVQWTYSNIGANPTLISSQPGSGFYGESNLQVDNLDTGMFKSTAENYGTIYIYVDSAESFQSIYTAVSQSGFIENCAYNSQMFMLAGTLAFNGAGAINETGVNITIIGGEMNHKNIPGNVQLNSCLISTMPALYGAKYNFHATGSIFYNTATRNTTLGYMYGSDLTFYNSPYFQYYDADIPYQTYIDEATGATITYGVIVDKTFKDTGKSTYLSVSYNRNAFLDCTLLPLYWALLNVATDNKPPIYMIENCIINESVVYTWHIMFYAYPAGQPYQNTMKFLNVDVDNDENIKKIIHNSILNMSASFYRTAEFHIKDTDDNPIQSASITLMDTSGSVYTASTDITGSAYIDYLEQLTVFSSQSATISSWDPTFDTYYAPDIILISGSGYATQSLQISNVNDTKFFDVTLQPNQYIYLDKINIVESIDAALDNNKIKSNINEENLTVMIGD